MFLYTLLQLKDTDQKTHFFSMCSHNLYG